MVLTICIILIVIIIVIIFYLETKLKLITQKIHPWLVKHATLLGSYRSILAFIAFPIVIIGGIYTYSQLIERLDSPDVGLEFVHKKSIAVNVLNLSNIVVYDPKYWFILFNVDRPIKERPNPLQIPTRKGDYIRIGENLGPNVIISIVVDKREVKEGDRIVGFAGVTCPKCPKHFYWVYIKHGEGGWYAKMYDEEWQAQLNLDFASSEKSLSEFFNLVAEERRIPIE